MSALSEQSECLSFEELISFVASRDESEKKLKDDLNNLYKAFTEAMNKEVNASNGLNKNKQIIFIITSGQKGNGLSFQFCSKKGIILSDMKKNNMEEILKIFGDTITIDQTNYPLTDYVKMLIPALVKDNLEFKEFEFESKSGGKLRYTGEKNVFEKDGKELNIYVVSTEVANKLESHLTNITNAIEKLKENEKAKASDLFKLIAKKTQDESERITKKQNQLKRLIDFLNEPLV